ncbi:TPA: hypothetical protein N0F65_003187 [Lagenidium giganteum]|uniref:Kinesin motor domain-containing protein n=1 Tax=Lagenidium giganteum TaxID=4803 RepID=A0AAV2ZCC6_9STRA|nr:TPA: hypothetical protein N0F65_003187 [Lagenidium giganteum]
MDTTLRVDHVFQQGNEADITERSLDSLVKACTDGVNVAVLGIGTSRSNKQEYLFQRVRDVSIASAVFDALSSTLDNKQRTINAQGKKASFSWTVTMTFAEFYEERISNLLASLGRSNTSEDLCIEDDELTGRTIRGLTEVGPIASLSNFNQLLETGRRARSTMSGVYGSASEFSSAVLRMNVTQQYTPADGPSQQLVSVFDVYDLPATDRLDKPANVVRLTEGPLLNKALLALKDVVDNAARISNNVGAKEPSGSYCVPYEESVVTQLLRESIGGNCVTLGIIFVVPGDYPGTRATIELGRSLAQIHNFPLVNSEMLRGLLRRQHRELAYFRSLPTSTAGESANSDVYVQKAHQLEGKYTQETWEKQLLREEKEKLALSVSELKLKYQELFNNEIGLRKELLTCEQDKLALSKAFVEFQIQANEQLQAFDNEKFELQNKLIQAEQMVLEIQDDDSKKAAQIQDLCKKMDDMVREKKTMSEEMVLVQKHASVVEQTREKESKKNQQLSLELVVLVNQKQAHQVEMEAMSARLLSAHKELDEERRTNAMLTHENETLKSLKSAPDVQVDAMKKEVMKMELEMERTQLQLRTLKVEKEKEMAEAIQEKLIQIERLEKAVEIEKLNASNTKTSLEFRVERLEMDLGKANDDNRDLNALLKTKIQEHEELVLLNEQLAHENQSQVDEFRLKLTILSSREEKSASLSEVIHTYQSREKSLRQQLAATQHRLHRLLLQQFSAASSSDASQEPLTERLTELDETIKSLRDKLSSSEQQLVLELEKQTSLALTISQLEQQNAKLVREKEQLGDDARRMQEKKSTMSNGQPDQYLEMKRMQDQLLQQIAEVKRLTMLKQALRKAPAESPTITASPERPSLERPAAQQSDLNREVDEIVRALTNDKQILEKKLEEQKMHFNRALEDVERRCAELLTQNVMLKEENQIMQRHVKVCICLRSFMEVPTSFGNMHLTWLMDSRIWLNGCTDNDR